MTRKRELVRDGKKRDGDDDRDGGVIGDDEVEVGEPDCPVPRKGVDSATRDT